MKMKDLIDSVQQVDPKIWGNPEKPQLENMPTIIFDIDGTLADIEHRRHFVTGKKKDFDAFNAAMVNDVVNQPIANLLWMSLSRFDTTQVIFCTGRMEQFREVTRNFLLDDCEVEEFLSLVNEEHRSEPKYRRMVEDHLDTYLMMRPDNRRHDPDKDIKQDMLNEILKTVDKSNILFAVDDRQRVVDMWRSNGITCLQVAEGNF
jgi:phosphoglycolate phosphatase-like HAD superfamily hydrolase